MIVQRLTQSAEVPFDQANLAEHCRVNTEDAPELIRHGIAAASELEQYAQIALLDQTIRVTLERWPRCQMLELPIVPVLDALSVTMTADGAAFESFGVITGMRPAIRLGDVRPCGQIVIEYLAGFGEAATDVPPDLVHAILDQATALFDLRGAGDGKGNGMSPHMARVAARYRRVAI
ncbi:MAG: hypothetical protein K0B00_08260 [Rhodobacteraceae bacterium]|nr:hypothetical protein [Paracoccaceae bacterium]